MHISSAIFSLLSLCIFATPIQAQAATSATAPSPQASAACLEISTGSAETQIWPAGLTNPDYEDAKNHYYSAANADLTPACAVFPTSATEVSFVVKVLLKYPTVPFAMKSGGHSPNVGFSSTNWGVLITFSKDAATAISANNATAEVGPGARWGQVIGNLTAYNVAVVGGRLVGGLLLGGGLSFLSAQYGLACDSVVNYEIVLADGSIVNANATSFTDLFWALKGGGNQFGIVTKFTLKTYPIPPMVWGGTRTYSGLDASALLNATQNFIQNNNDPKAAVIVTGSLAIENLAELFVLFYFYDGPTPPAGIFDEFDAIVPIADQVSTQSYADIVNTNDQFNIYGLRYIYRAETIPNLPGTSGTDLYNAIYNNWLAYIISQDTLLPGFTFSLGFQPLQALTAAAAVAAGGDVLGLDPGNGDRNWLIFTISWETAAGDAVADSLATILANDVVNHSKTHYAGVRNTRYKEGNLSYEEYDPIYSNDAMYSQSPYSTFAGNNYARLKAIQKKYDPNRFLATRTGGFKYT
ncbi:FAD-binding domain-containing protein [Hyaloscypha variabilis F]|uniref:FAD-binding domain-containing protein n=1 Tax=Hyaloscypha variabilis (strain UAMH 11265 / GT02V1 / F) TaxID=1149755 RepID=A0A2J6S9I1_HYAVF|nr:FAD-binding domain-containing protein [Hyaloscypha variabilis F]